MNEITCKVSSKVIKHSRPEDNPEMFTVYGNGGGRPATSIVCLSHAAAAERKGYRVEIILT
jgi:hypothetical protein